jgi:hypothetical protein
MMGDAPAQLRQWLDIVLGVLIGFSGALALAPWLTTWYFQAIGWPHRFNSGPLVAAPLGDFLCWGNVTLLVAFPLLAIMLGIAFNRQDRLRELWWCLGLALIQFVSALINLLPLLWLFGD